MVPRVTSKASVRYFVTKVAEEQIGSWAPLDDEVELAYLHHLSSDCYKEKQAKAHVMAQAQRSWSNQRRRQLEAKADAMTALSCRKLEQLRSQLSAAA